MYVRLSAFLTHRRRPANNALSLTWPNISGHDTRPAWNRSFYAYGTFDIEDSEGELLPNFTLPRRVAAGAPVNMSIVGCNLEGQHSTIGVNTTTRLAATSGTSYLASSAEWAPWKPLDPVPPEDLNILDLVRAGIGSALPLPCAS